MRQMQPLQDHFVRSYYSSVTSYGASSTQSSLRKLKIYVVGTDYLFSYVQGNTGTKEGQRSIATYYDCYRL